MATFASLQKYLSALGQSAQVAGGPNSERSKAAQKYLQRLWGTSSGFVTAGLERLGLKRGSLEYLILTRLPLLAMLAALIGNIVLAVPFTARAKLLIPFGREYTYRPIVGEGINLAPWRQEVAINTEMEILNGTTVKTEVVKLIGPERLLGDPEPTGDQGPIQAIKHGLKILMYHAGLAYLPKPPLEKGLEVLNRGLEITTVKDSNVVHVAFTNADRDLGMRVLAALLDRYIALRSQYFEPPDSPVLNDVLVTQQQDLRHAERALEDYKTKNNITLIEAQLKNAFEQEMNIKKLYTDIEVQLTQTTGKQNAAGILEEMPSEAVAELKATIGGLQSAKSELGKKSKEALAQIAALEAHKASINQLEDEVKIRRERLLRIREKSEEIRLERSLSDARWSNVRIIEPPFSPEQPAALGPMVKIALAGIVGLLAAIGLSLGLLFANGWMPRITITEENSTPPLRPTEASAETVTARRRKLAQ